MNPIKKLQRAIETIDPKTTTIAPFSSRYPINFDVANPTTNGALTRAIMIKLIHTTSKLHSLPKTNSARGGVHAMASITIAGLIAVGITLALVLSSQANVLEIPA